MKGIDVIVIGDFNARSSIWGDVLESECAKLLQFCAANDLIIVNEPNSEPIFTGGMGNSWVDLIMIGFTNRSSKIENWKVSEEESLSDHSEIRFL